MDIPTSSLHNQQVQNRKKFSFRFGFIFLFILSVGLNVYLLGFDSETDFAVAAQDSQEVEEIAQVSMKPVEVLKEEPPKVAPTIIKPVSFSVSSPEIMAGKTIHSMRFKVRSSLNYTVCRIMARDKGCASLSAHLGRLMAWFMDIKKSMRNGDALEVMYEEVDGPEQFKILKLSYESQRFGKTFEAFYYDEGGQGNGGYFDRSGKEIARRIVEKQSPIRQYTEITSLPGDFRKAAGGHSGTDFKAKVGTPIYSGFAGKVIRTNWNVRANGYCVEVDHPDLGIKTLYLHLSKVLVKRGQTLRAGQQIAESGNTGRSFAPHLHYEIQNRKNKRTIYNPFKLKHHKSYTREIAPQYQQAFEKTINLYNSVTKES